MGRALGFLVVGWLQVAGWGLLAFHVVGPALGLSEEGELVLFVIGLVLICAAALSTVAGDS